MATPNSTALPVTTSVDALAGKEAERPSGNNGVEVDPKRLLGAFYTPDSLAGILVRWALKGTKGAILDPSFGGCAFLAAAVKELARMGVKEPGHFVYGVDIDFDCREHVRRNARLVEGNCIVRDFLDLAPSEMPGTPFQAIVGNPPFVRHHWLKGDKRDAARLAIETSGFHVPATASTWAYFLVHSLAFLEEGGRLAMLVPEAILQADYATSIRRALSERFSRVLLVHIRDRLFEGTDEPVVVVAGAGYGKSGNIDIESIEEADDLESVLIGSTARPRTKRITVANGRSVTSETLTLLEEIERHEQVRRISDVAAVRIGFVTGANSHFIRSLNELERLGVPSQARLPVVARTRWLSSLDFTRKDHRFIASSGRRAFLVRPTARFENHDGVRRWIEEGEAAGIQHRFKCARRTQWFHVELPKVPDLFATCTRLGPPLIIVNGARLHCSNTLHALHWKPKAQVAPEAVAIGFLTSAVGVWAELHGRRYGGGVLKTEPGKLGQAPVPMVPASVEVYDELNRFLRAGQEEEARRLADRVVLGEGLGLEDREIRRLQRALKELMRQRLPTRREGRCA